MSSGEPARVELQWVTPKEYEDSLDSGSNKNIGEDEEQTDGAGMVVTNGIHLKRKGESQPFALFSYCPAPMMEVPVRTDWKLIAQEPIVMQHIRCRQLHTGENLASIIAGCDGEFTKALILINTEDNYIISRDFQWEGMAQPEFPVCVIGLEDGQRLVSMVQQNEVVARIEANNVSESQAMKAKSPSPEELSLTLEQAKSKRKIRMPFKKPRVDLKKRLKEMMTPPPATVPRCVSESKDLFSAIMEELYNYEQADEVHAHDHHANTRVFEKLLKFVSQGDVFFKDCPFYLAVAYRVFKFQKSYHCEKHNEYIHTIINKFEEMVAHNDVESILKFARSGDFQVHFDEGYPSTSVFHLLERACIILMKESAKMKFRLNQNGPLKNKMIWLSVSLKFKSLSGQLDGTKTWYDYALKDSSSLTLDATGQEDLAFGLKLGELLKLPVQSSFRAEQLGQLLSDGTHVRPFSQITGAIQKAEPYFHVSDEFLTHVLTGLREPYRKCLEPANKKIEHLSLVSTLLGAIQEGLKFLDSVHSMWHKKGWSLTSYDREMSAWIYLLLGAVDVSGDKAISYLKEFIVPTSGHDVCSVYQHRIVNQTLDAISNNYNRLSIIKFSRLFSQFADIFPLTALQDYMQVYKMPARMNINDETWAGFFGAIVNKFPGAENHGFILEFLILVSQQYVEERRPKEYIYQLLSMNIPGLFAVDAKLKNDHSALSVPLTFQTMLRDYIQRNRLIESVIGHVTAIWKSIQSMSEFQLNILTVLQKELIPESRSLQAPINESIKKIIDDTVGLLSYDTSWLEDTTPHHKFAFGVAAICCSCLPLSQTLDWMESYSLIIENLGRIYQTYCKSKGLQDDECVITQLPEDVASSSLEDMHAYFQWVIDVQRVLNDWKTRFLENSLNFDDLQTYNAFCTHVYDVGKAVCASTLVISMDEANLARTDFLKMYERLNCHLIKYIAGHPEAGWLLLPNLLSEYGIEIPEKVLVPMTRHLVFPDDDKTTPQANLTTHQLAPSHTGTFKPGNDVALTLTKDVTLFNISTLVLSLDQLLKPIESNLDLLIYFFLHKSIIFDTYLRYQLRKYSGVSHESMHSVTSSLSRVSRSMTFLNTIRRGSEPFKGITWKTLAQALSETEQLVVKLVEGTAQYTDVTAGGHLQLEKMDLDMEFKVLVEYTNYTHPGESKHEGLKGIQCMLELFQFSHHIHSICNVCEQYHISGCLEDPQLQEIKLIADNLQDISRRDQLTPKEAIESVEKIVSTLCLKKRDLGYDKRCLRIFPAVADSSMFYQFIKDKEFYGPVGQEVFQQKYNLITAQLQHEEYNEVVLNHLSIAYKIISPFLDVEQDFHGLMSQVSGMNITTSCQELQTVNKNIHLVRLWFSRAEEDTLEMVPSELEAMLQTGEFQFLFTQMPNGVKASVFLEYTPSSMAQAISTPARRGTAQSSDASPEITESLLSRRDFTSAVDDASRATPTPGGRRDTMTPPPAYRMQRWNKEQIRDFEQRLGFLDPDSKLKENVNKFLGLTQKAYKLLELYQRLKDLGHPLYTELDPVRNMTVEDQPLVSNETEAIEYTGENPIPFRTLDCTLAATDVEKKVSDAEGELHEWNRSVEDLRKEFVMLLFFSIPKLLKVHKKLTDSHIDNVVADISFLFKNNLIVREKLKASVKLVLPQIKSLVESCSAPMDVVGRFLHKLFTEHDMSRYALQPRHPYRQLARSLSSQAASILHSCHGLSRSQLMSLIINCYNGIPESYQLFRCHSETTEDELKLFLSRVSQHPFQYMVIGIEKLPYQLQEHLLQFQLKVRPLLFADGEDKACLNFIETGPSVLREMPWIMVKDHKDGTALMYDRAKKICRQGVMAFEDFQCITMVYGHPGDGKSHLIKTRLRNRLTHMVLTIPVNEAFTPLLAIKKLQTLPTDTRGCCIYFNFTILPPSTPGVLDNEKKAYQDLMDTVNWFFFDLLVLGYVEDLTSGESFRLPGGLSWGIFIEVPCRSSDMEPAECLNQFLDDIPTLGLVGSKELVESRRPYVIDDDVQLVCKYLKAYETGGKNGIDKLYKEARRGKPEQLVKFSLEPDLEGTECHRLLSHYTPTHMMKNKTLQKLFVSYMRRRCHFLDNLPAYNYNTGGAEMTINEKGKRVANNTRHLGSTLMKAFLREVEEFCDPDGQADWSKKPHQQLIYDEVDGGASIGLISLRSDKLLEEERERFKEISIQLPSLLELHSRQWLDDYLSRALSVPLDQMNRLKIIDDSAYVLTLDYTIKMLNIHERYECGMPVIIEGETGVGKTALVEVLSKLWNSAHLNEWQRSKGTLVDFMHKKLEQLLEFAPERKAACISIINSVSGSQEFTQEDIQLIAELPDTTSGTAQFHTTLLKEMLKMKDNPVLSLLHQPNTESKKSFNYLFRAAEYRNNAKETAELLYAILTTQVKYTFHKLNVHAALSPSEVIAFFKDVADKAYEIQDAYKKCKDASSRMKIPSVTVFLDEVNTASCLGLFKEIIVDRSFDGTVLPDNVFVIGACNPHRGDSLATLASDNSWVRSHYYVRVLHPTMDMLKWDYGSLDEHQEREYINAKLRLVNSEMSDVQLANLTELIVTSQNLMRAYAYNQLRTLNVEEGNAAVCSKSSVSQRDIQRVFTFYEWLMKIYNTFQPHGEGEDYQSCAIMVSLAMVYYMRLDGKYRSRFSEAMDKSANKSVRLPFTDTLLRELDWYVDQMDIPLGIAKTQALKENIFATIICTMTHTPLIIVGPPGCSKTLSFNLVTANLRGQESKIKLFRDTSIFQSLDSHYYQCSRRTTSNEIQTVFSRAVNRQRSYANVPLPIYCVVFMDEAGLPEESLESLKVLHYHLDQREVSFVAISNHMLDAAKTNRAVTLFRSEPSIEELKTLAKGCLCETPNDPPIELQKDIDVIVKFCPVYHKFMESADFCSFYGLRDFIHFINYLKAHRQKGITEKVVMQALERNFNGHKMFDTICKEFLNVMNCSIHKVTHRTILDIIKNSLKDRPHVDNKDYEVRYKLIIDSSEDNSLLRLLFAFRILKERDTRTYICSDFPGDMQQQMINTIAAIRHSASAGHIVIMSQTDEIHESFYDLFNQRFRRIDDPKTGPRYYANVAIGAHHKPCRVHPLFQCVVVVKQSEINDIPRPFLNRFEKYALTHRTLVDAVLDKQPAYLKAVILRAKEKASEFIEHVDRSSSLYGFHEDTLDSLILSLLPPVGFQEFLETDKRGEDKIPEGERPDLFLLRRLLRALRRRAGFRIPHFTREELAADTDYVMRLVARDSQFAGQLNSLTCQDVLYAIPEALGGLYHSNKGGRTDLSSNACMVISVFLQWLVHHLVKRLMQLMTTEALTKQYRLLPHQYTECYLKHQSHFNLQTLIDKQLQVMELDDAIDRSTTGTANRLLLFTRSSALIHQLPARYPNPGSSQQDYDQMISKLVYPFSEDVCVCKLSSVTSQASINDLLNSFWHSKQQRILLLVANMKETSKETISHLRVMIEENDTGERLKLYVLLLHFPPSMFTDCHCYPSLFSNTWDHHYLDIIGQNSTGKVMDINEWFSLCCNYLSSRNNPHGHASINLSTLLNEAIPMISSRVFFGKNEDSPFNCPMEVPKRNAALQELFDTGVGEILSNKFLKYWEPTVMLEYLEKAASLTTTIQTSTLSITDSVQTIIRDTFFDFIVYMISKMNEDMNIDILLDPQCSDVTKKLFLDLLRAYPLPKLSQVKTLSSFANSISSLEASQHAPYVPKFPFYRLVSSAMEKIIEQTRKEINQRLDTLHEFPDPRFSISQMSISSLPKVIEDKSHLVVNMQKAVEYTIKQCLESTKSSPLKVAIEAMLSNPDLFKKYSEAFTHQKLRLGASTTGISFRILRLTFTHLHPDQDMLARLALLHICMHVYQLDLSRLVQVLRPLDTLLDMTAVMPDDPFSEAQPSPTASFLTSVKESGDLLGQPGDLSKYILKILFSALVGSVYGQTSQDEDEAEKTITASSDTLMDWCDVYRDVMSMLAVKEYLYKNLTELSETQHNIMHATFLTVQCNESMDDDLLMATTKRIFTDLFERHFTDGLELKKAPPRLQEIIEAMVQEIDSSSVDVSLQRSNPQMRRILEGLFAHFFSSYRTSPNAEDCQWFLELINKNVQWNAKDLDVLAARTSEFFKDKSPALRRSAPSPQGEDGHGCIPMSVYKYYLTIILDKTDINTQSFTSLNLYKPWVRKLVGAVLSNGVQSSKPGPYVPIFYQSCPSVDCSVSGQNKLMQQPLAHLYFVTVLHNLLTNNYSLAGLVRISDAITTSLDGDNTVSDQIVLYLEQQAVVQATIQQLAKTLNPSDPNGIATVAPIIRDINHILDNEKLGGGDKRGHGLVLVYHLLKELRSFSQFSDMFGSNSYLKDFNCLVGLNVNVEFQEEAYLFPFLASVGKGNLLKDVYDKVGRAMTTASASGGRKIQPLTSVAHEWSQGQVTITLPDGQEVQGERSSIFRMVLWLNAYYKFYCQKKSCQLLVDMLRDQLLYIVQPAPLNRLICCFLDPSLMNKEEPGPDAENYTDPLHSLFNSTTRDDNPSDVSLRHALANMIAVVVAAPPSSTHLWYHMFAADQLHKTYIAGFMLETPVGQDGVFYDAGVQLTQDGRYAKQNYLKHVTRGTLTLQSLYLLLWANAGAFCIGLLTDPEAESKMMGTVFPQYYGLRQFCMSQLRTLWHHLSRGLGISVEERSYLVSRCMWNLLKISNRKGQMAGGYLSNVTQLNNYETMWTTTIFTPVWETLQDGFAKHLRLYEQQIFTDIKMLETQYPSFPTEGALLQALLSNATIGDHIANRQYFLGQFALLRRQLEIGGDLLPNLVEFYQWLHQELSHVVTRNDAETIPLSRAVRVLAKSYSPEEGDRLHSLFKKMKESYNQYKEVTGHSLPLLEDTTPLLHVLSCSSDGDGSPDLLYTIISMIITTHNTLLTKAESMVRNDPDLSYARYLPQELSRVHPTEFTDQNCIVERSISLHGLTEFEQLICRRSTLPSPSQEVTGSHTSLPGWQPSLINVSQLQEDVFATQLAGKPLIGPPQSLRTHFQFRDAIHHAKENLSAIEGDLETISSKLLDEFKCTMDQATAKRLEMQFHNTSYHTIMETVSGLRGVAGHLIKQLMGISQSELMDLHDLTVSDFLYSVFNTSGPLKSIVTGAKKSIFHEIGIHSLTQDQFKSLEELRLVHLYDCLRWFVTWVSQGWYEYCSLPFSMKARLSTPDSEAMHSLPGRYTRSSGQLLKDLKALVMVLNHFESTSTITSMAFKNPQLSIVELLSKLGECTEQEELLQLIPDTVLMENYVAFCVALKQLISNLQMRISAESLTAQPHRRSWEDFVDDLWKNNLTQFRSGTYSYAVVMTSDHKKRVYSLRNIDRSDEELLNDLMTAGVSESELLPDTDIEDSSPNSAGSSITSYSPRLRRTRPKRGLEESSISSSISTQRLESTRTVKLAEGVSCEQVCDFLREIGLEQYVPKFEEYSIMGDVLYRAGQGSGLEELGVMDALHRLKISVLFRRKLEGESKVFKRYPVEEVIRFLNMHNMPEYVERFEKEGIDGELLLEATDDALIVLGVEKQIHRITIRSKFSNYVTPQYTTL